MAQRLIERQTPAGRSGCETDDDTGALRGPGTLSAWIGKLPAKRTQRTSQSSLKLPSKHQWRLCSDSTSAQCSTDGFDVKAVTRYAMEATGSCACGRPCRAKADVVVPLDEPQQVGLQGCVGRDELHWTALRDGDSPSYLFVTGCTGIVCEAFMVGLLPIAAVFQRWELKDS